MLIAVLAENGYQFLSLLVILFSVILFLGVIMKNFTTLKQIPEDIYFIFKHSSTCGMSALAHQVVSEAKDSLSYPIYKLIVQKDRPSSIEVAEHFGIRHESPQLILVKNDNAIWNASHGSISPSSIRLALEKLDA